MSQAIFELNLHGECPPDGDHDDPLGEVHADEEGRLAHIDMEGGVHNLDVLVAEDLPHGGHVAVTAVVPHHDAVLRGHHAAVSAAAPGQRKKTGYLVLYTCTVQGIPEKNALLSSKVQSFVKILKGFFY